MKTIVTFKSDAFNTSKPMDYFINPGCFGDDAANWMIRELRARGDEPTEEPHQEDYGWYFGFRVDGVDHVFIIGYRPGDAQEHGTWIGWLERKRGVIASMLLGRKNGITSAATRSIHAILSTSRQIHDVRWYDPAAFDRGEEKNCSAEP